MHFTTIITIAFAAISPAFAAPINIDYTAANGYVSLIGTLRTNYNAMNLTKHDEKKINSELRDVWEVIGNSKPDWKHGTVSDLLQSLEDAAPIYPQFKTSTRRKLIEELYDVDEELREMIQKSNKKAEKEAAKKEHGVFYRLTHW